LSATADIHCRGPFKPGGPRVREAGFSLVEVLVAMFVVSIGILALAALLQGAMRYSKMGELRATATLLAGDIADRIRANPGAGEAGPGGYDLSDEDVASPPAPPHATCSSEAPCGPSELARLDVADWSARLHATLPQGVARIQFQPGHPPAPSYVDVWVGWADPLTLSPGVSTEHADADCPDGWTTSDPPMRCVYLQVAL